ncbi:MAG: DUF4446 family protein, partial [Lachnospiraceae bacterium]|nr:DUF4446 family protein [Lachnospiraceae bacterium]
MSDFLSAIGLGGLDLGVLCLILLLLILVLLAFLVILWKRVRNLTARCDRFLRGKSGASLEQDIDRIYEDNINLKRA